MSINHEQIIKDRVESNLYDLSYESYTNCYSSSDHSKEINYHKMVLRELAIICNECEIKVPKDYIGYNGYEIDTEHLDFEHFVV